MDKVNVLCLHGCCQNEKMFRSLLKSLIKKGRGVSFHFLEGPFDHPDGGKTWTDPPLKVEDIWHDSEGKRENIIMAVPGVEYNDAILTKTFSVMSDYIQEHNITILLGFSQGSFACYEYVRKFRNPTINKIVAMSGYTFVEEISPFLDVEIMNVVHPMDNIVPKSLAYSNQEKTTLLTHNDKELVTPSRDGHKCPHRAAHIRAILEFITKE